MGWGFVNACYKAVFVSAKRGEVFVVEFCFGSVCGGGLSVRVAVFEKAQKVVSLAGWFPLNCDFVLSVDEPEF
jgi:hypothetical protein